MRRSQVPHRQPEPLGCERELVARAPRPGLDHRDREPRRELCVRYAELGRREISVAQRAVLTHEMIPVRQAVGVRARFAGGRRTPRRGLDPSAADPRQSADHEPGPLTPRARAGRVKWQHGAEYRGAAARPVAGRRGEERLVAGGHDDAPRPGEVPGERPRNPGLSRRRARRKADDGRSCERAAPHGVERRSATQGAARCPPAPASAPGRAPRAGAIVARNRAAGGRVRDAPISEMRTGARGRRP